MLLFHICTSMLKIIKMTNGMQERLHYSLQGYIIVCKTAVCWSNFFDTNALVVWMNILSMTNKVLDKPSFSRELHRYDR